MNAVKETTKKYYKYIEREGGIPIFSSATQAYYGVDGVSVYPNDIWSAVGTSYNTPVANSNSTYYIFTFENGAKITSVTYCGYVIANRMPSAVYYGLEAYDETTGQWVVLSTRAVNTTLTTVPIDNNNFYRQYRINLRGSEVNIYATMGVNTIKMEGIIRDAQESNEHDYDVIKYTNHYKLVKDKNNIYYGIG